MRRRILALALLLCFFLTGCGGILDRSYSTETPHSQFSDEGKNSSVLRADTYEGLVAAMLHLISNGQESGVIRLYDYSGAAEQDVDRACLEVTTQDPLGAYAVDYIKYDMARLTGYLEVDLKLFYKRTWQQISAVSSVTGSGAVFGELRAALLDFQKETVLRVNYFDESMTPEGMVSMVEEAYYDVPEAAFGKPQVKVRLYPEQAVSEQRLIEILLEYPAPRETLKEKQAKLLTQVEIITRPLLSKKSVEKVTLIISKLKSAVLYSAEAEGTAYAALLEGKANQEGLTLAAELLLQKSGLQCRVVRGTKNGTSDQWLVIQMEDTWQHLDVAADKPKLLGDRAMQDAGYRWSGDIPVCRDMPTGS